MGKQIINPLAHQNRFVGRLVALTKQKKAVWLKDGVNPDVGYCFIGNELFIFKVEYGTSEAEKNTKAPDKVMCFTRNLGIFWPSSLPEFKTLQGLINEAITDRRLYVRMRRGAADFQLKKLAGIGKKN